MTEYIHEKDCAWEKADCEYKETHYYCPHPEHTCSCVKVQYAGGIPSEIKNLILDSLKTWAEHGMYDVPLIGDFVDKEKITTMDFRKNGYNSALRNLLVKIENLRND